MKSASHIFSYVGDVPVVDSSIKYASTGNSHVGSKSERAGATFDCSGKKAGGNWNFEAVADDGSGRWRGKGITKRVSMIMIISVYLRLMSDIIWIWKNSRFSF